MLKIVVAAVMAAALIFIGLSQILSLKPPTSALPTRIAIDYEPVCDETNYLEIGSSYEPIMKESKADDAIFTDQERLAFVVKNFLTVDDKETLNSILRPKGISEQEIGALSKALSPYMLPKDLAAGDYYRLELNQGDEDATIVEKLVIRKLDPNRLPVLYTVERRTKAPESPSFTLDVREASITEEQAVIRLRVFQTLYATFNTLPFGNELMQRLIAVFAWELRLPEGVLSGDEIEILVSKKYALGEFIGFGKIQSVYYRQKGRTLFASFFTSKDNTIRGFFDENGRSLEKEFAYSPVFETTATSNQKWRLHPIRNIRIKHNGIDYRGKIGTESFSIADGTIKEIRDDDNVGNMMRIEHKYGVHSEYFHADTLEKNLRVGDRVKRGQKIGTIGRTGKMCTGPHLHMGLYRLQGEKRRFLELASLKKLLKPAPSIDKEHMTEYKAHLKTQLAHMHREPIPEQTASIREGAPVVHR